MKKMGQRKLKKILLALVIVYVSIGLLFYLVQDKLLFHPTALAKDHRFQFDLPYEEVNHAFEGNNISILKFRPGQPRKGIVLFYHGNMNHMEHYKKYPPFFTKNGYEVWMVDYPGFGKTTGDRSEPLIYSQALEFYRLALNEISSDSLVIYGKSIGTGIASYVAANGESKQLILETPYLNIEALARHYLPVYPVGLMVKYRFPTSRYLRRVRVPVTIFHGTRDEIIPFKHAKLIQRLKPGVELIAIEDGRHNDLSDHDLFRKKLDSLLSN